MSSLVDLLSEHTPLSPPFGSLVVVLALLWVAWLVSRAAGQVATFVVLRSERRTTCTGSGQPPRSRSAGSGSPRICSRASSASARRTIFSTTAPVVMWADEHAERRFARATRTPLAAREDTPPFSR